MSRASIVLLCTVLGMQPITASAALFSCVFDDDGGSVKGSMQFDFVYAGGKTTLTLTVKNTSPLQFNGSSNYPVIRGFAFDMNPDDAPVEDWSMVALDSQLNSILLGDMAGTVDKDDKRRWVLELYETSNLASPLKYDFTSVTDSGVNGALFNPEWEDAGGPPGGTGNTGPYYTDATLTVIFTGDVTLDTAASMPFMKFQTVGTDGNRSLKTVAGNFGEPVEEVPLPSGLALLISTLIPACSFRAIKRRRKIVQDAPV